MLVSGINTDFLWCLLSVHDPTSTIPYKKGTVGQTRSLRCLWVQRGNLRGSQQSMKVGQQHLSGGAGSGLWKSADRFGPIFLSHWKAKGAGDQSHGGDLSTRIWDGLEIFFLKCILFGLNVNIGCFYSPPHANSILFLKMLLWATLRSSHHL